MALDQPSPDAGRPKRRRRRGCSSWVWGTEPVPRSAERGVRQQAQPLERGLQLFRPGPALGQPQDPSPARAHQPSGEVQEPLAQPLGLGERKLATE